MRPLASRSLLRALEVAKFLRLLLAARSSEVHLRRPACLLVTLAPSPHQLELGPKAQVRYRRQLSVSPREKPPQSLSLVGLLLSLVEFL